MLGRLRAFCIDRDTSKNNGCRDPPHLMLIKQSVKEVKNVLNNNSYQLYAVQNQFTAYLMTAIRNHKASYMKSQGKIRLNEINGDIPIHAIPMDRGSLYLPFEEQFENECLSHALRQLNKRDRYIFFSRVLGEKSWKELAAELNMSYGAVAMSYHRTVKRLRTILEK